MMPNPEQIEVMAETVLRETDYSATGQEAHDMLRTIAAEMRKSEPVAWTSPTYLEHLKRAGMQASAGMYRSQSDHYSVALYPHPSADAEDARRYRWLRDMHNAGDPHWFIYGASDNLNEDVDAAMQVAK